MTSTPYKISTAVLSLVLLVIAGLAIDARIPIAPHSVDQMQGTPTALAIADDHLVVGTYNIRGAKGDKGADAPTPLSVFVDLMNKPAVDIVGLNEVRTLRYKQTNHAELLAREMGAGWFFASTARRLLLQELGNAVLARIPVHKIDVVPLLWSAADDGEAKVGRSHRNMLKVHTEVGGQSVVVLITHLDRGPLRLQQLAGVVAEMAHHDNVILLGDLNSGHTDINPLLSSQAITDAVCAGRDHSGDHIDHILVKGFQVAETGEHPRGPSDHPYYWAKLVLGKTGPE